MEKLSIKKQMQIIKSYFAGLSYREIAKKTNVSTGAIAGVITNLKAGTYPELFEVVDQTDMLREIAVEVNKSKMNLSECVTGVAVINGLKELGVEPADILQCVSVCKTLVPDSLETQTFAKAAIEYKEVTRRTGLSAEDLEKKVTELEKVANQLQPVSRKVLDLQKQLKELEAKKAAMTNELAVFEKQERKLSETIKERERREENLSTRIISLESGLQSNEEQLAIARKDLAKLSKIGLSVDELSVISERIKGIAHRLAVEPKDFNSRLLNELERLGKGMTLETLVRTKQRELQAIQAEISTAHKTSEALTDQIQSCREELSGVQAQIVHERNKVVEELNKMVAAAQNTEDEFRRGLVEGLNAILMELVSVKNLAFETGQTFGELETKMKNNTWLHDILSIMQDEDKVAESQARIISLMFLKSIHGWLERNHPYNSSLFSIKRRMSELITEVQRWKPQTSLAEGSKNLSSN